MDGVPPPQATRESVGHRDARRELAQALDSGRLHHAWLLQGPRGIGKATVAFDFARTVLAHGGRDGEAVFRQVALGSHPNLLHLTRPAAERGPGFRTQITVDEVRRLNRFFQSTPGEGAYRVAIVDPVDDMNRSAANALLKMLEEPPTKALFLIVNHSAGRLLPTIRSRCRMLRFAPLPPSDLLAALETVLPGHSAQERARAAELGQGSVRRAVAMLENGGLEIATRLEAVLAPERPDWNQIQALADALTAKGREAGYDLLLESLLQAIAGESERLLSAGQKASAARLAAYHASESERLRVAAAYNLDRRQAVLTLVAGLFEARSGTRATLAH
ncbi:DNA polymerase III subunit delta' [Aurantimonas sp. Leaf443]|nr:DNA polymerase III subunit delta' [Aurantimonas sp. Leaf443]